MRETVVGLFHTSAEADHAVGALTADGFDPAAVSVVTAADTEGSTFETSAERQSEEALVRESMAVGAVEGAALGGVAGLLAGAVALAVPGFGPLFIAGPIASLLTSTAAGVTAGAASGGLGGPFLNESLDPDEASLYSEGLRRGGYIVAVHTDRENEAQRILADSGAIATREELLR